jgi:putative ABC transport system permease protein
MISLSFWRTALKLSWSGLRRAPSTSIFLLLASAVSISGISGVHGAARIARETLRRDARVWLGGDIAADTGAAIGEDRWERVTATPGVQATVVSWTMTMAASSESPDAGFIALKAVDPSVYPFYGKISLSPPLGLAAALASNGAAVNKDVLRRFGVSIGDTIRLGGRPFRITAVIQAEPERYNGFFGAGLRAMISRGSLEQTDIPRGANPLKNRLIVRLPGGADLAASKRWLQDLFPEGSVMDFHTANREGVERVETFMTFFRITAFFALVIGSIGIAIVSRLQIEQRMPVFLVMKLIGGRTPQIAIVCLIETVWLYLGAVVLGTPLGLLARSAVLKYSGTSIPLPLVTSLTAGDFTGSAIAGLISIAPLAARLVISIRTLRPAVILRSEVEESSRDSALRLSRLIFFSLMAGALMPVAFIMVGSWRSAWIVTAALTGAVGSMLVSTAVLLQLARLAVHLPRIRELPRLRYSLASLYRPGNRIYDVTPALAMAAMLMTATFTVATALNRTVVDSVKLEGAGLLIAGFEDRYQKNVNAVISHQPGVERIEWITQARAHLSSVDGVPTDAAPAVAGCRANLPHARDATAVELSDSKALGLGARLGSKLIFDTPAGQVNAVVSAIRHLDGVESNWYGVSLDCRSIDRDNLFDQALIGVGADQIESVRKAVMDAFPTLAVISAGDLLAMIRGASSDAVDLLRAVAWYQIAVSAGVFMAISAAARALRKREIGLLSALGARRAAIIGIYTCELAIVGAWAGLIGGLLAFALASVVLTAVLRSAQVTADLKTILAATVLSAFFTVIAGWLPLWRLLGRPPLETLRGE